MSMMCPRCQVKLSCKDSRRQPVGTVKRAYRCHQCGGCVYTIEVMVKFKDKKGREKDSKDVLARKAQAKARLARQILESQGIEP